jgi:hypothetical protein
MKLPWENEGFAPIAEGKAQFEDDVAQIASALTCMFNFWVGYEPYRIQQNGRRKKWNV